jgi:hypothetical protein
MWRKKMINRTSKFVISAALWGISGAPSHAQSSGATLNCHYSCALLSIAGMRGETNQTVVLGGERVGGLFNQNRRVLANSKFAFRIYPTTLSSPAASFLLYQHHKQVPNDFGYPFAGHYESDRSMKSLLPAEEVKTLFFTRSTVPLAQLWSGRLRFDGFMDTLNMQNVELGPSAASAFRDFRLPRVSYPYAPRSIDLYGVSVRFHVGRNIGIERPPQGRRYLSRIVGDLLG